MARMDVLESDALEGRIAGMTCFLNKIIDNFILTKARKLWERNGRKGWRRKGV